MYWESFRKVWAPLKLWLWATSKEDGVKPTISYVFRSPYSFLYEILNKIELGFCKCFKAWSDVSHASPSNPRRLRGSLCSDCHLVESWSRLLPSKHWVPCKYCETENLKWYERGAKRNISPLQTSCVSPPVSTIPLLNLLSSHSSLAFRGEIRYDLIRGIHSSPVHERSTSDPSNSTQDGNQGSPIEATRMSGKDSLESSQGGKNGGNSTRRSRIKQDQEVFRAALNPQDNGKSQLSNDPPNVQTSNDKAPPDPPIYLLTVAELLQKHAEDSQIQAWGQIYTKVEFCGSSNFLNRTALLYSHFHLFLTFSIPNVFKFCTSLLWKYDPSPLTKMDWEKRRLTWSSVE